MKTLRIAVVCALCMMAAAGCGKKEAEDASEADPQETQTEKTGNVVVDNLDKEPLP